VEIMAFQEGVPVFANPLQPIRIAMVSDLASSRFNIYYLDTSARMWNFIRKDFVLASRISDGSSATARFYALLNEPRKADPSQARFNVSFDKREFQELTEYDGVAFEVNQEEQTYDPKLAMKDWESVKVERMQDGTHYLITFANGNEAHAFRVVPVFEGTDYVLAERMYKQKIKAYEKSLLAEKTGTIKKENKADVSIGQRVFEITRFGIWNSACPHPLPTERSVNVKFTDAGNNAFAHIYFSERGRKILFTYSPEKHKAFSFNPEGNNIIWAVNAMGQVVAFNEQDLKKQAGKNADPVLVIGRQILLKDLEKLLGR
jgi:hypothetical protein